MNRRFRWADLQIRRFKNCWDRKELKKALETIPESLEETYKEALTKVAPPRQERVRKVLMWLTESLRPMTQEEIADVASCENPEELLGVLTSLLVTLIDEEDKRTFKLAHFSVKEYLIIKGADDKPPWYRFNDEQAHILISKMAVSLLLNTDRCTRSEDAKTENPLQKYSARFWPQHAAKVVDFNSEDSIERQREIDKLSSSKPHFTTWLQLHDHDAYWYGQYPHRQIFA